MGELREGAEVGHQSASTRLRRAATSAGYAHEAVYALIRTLLADERATDADHTAAIGELRAAYAGLDAVRWAIHHATRALEAAERRSTLPVRVPPALRTRNHPAAAAPPPGRANQAP